MTAIGGSLPGVLAVADARAAGDAPAAAHEQSAQFASLLAALIAPPAQAEADEVPAAGTPSEAEGDAGETGDALGTQAADERIDATTPGAESLVAASRAMAAEVTASLEPVRSPDALDPEFRERLARVVERMRALGHEVKIVETVRSQARQDKLFAQGRTAEGPVVTWTRASRHTEGRAADVVIDGRYEGPGYRTLHRVAAEEGLRTLGAKDPGHVELAGRHSPALGPRLAAVAEGPTAPATRALETLGAMAELGARVEHSRGETPTSRAATPAAHPGALAAVARVATVARVAEVAQVARVAASAGTSRAGGRASKAEGVPSTASRESERSTTARDDAGARLDALAQALASRAPAALAEGGADVGPVARLAGASQLDQVTRVLAARDAALGRPLHELTLALDGERGGVDRIMVGVTGRSVGATIEASDPRSAAQLGGRLDDLVRALERAGLDADAVRIATTEPRDAGRELGVRAGQVLDAGRGAGAGAQDRQQESAARDRASWAHDDRRQQQGGRHRQRRDQQETTE